MCVKAKLVTICFSSSNLDNWSKAASVWYHWSWLVGQHGKYLLSFII